MRHSLAVGLACLVACSSDQPANPPTVPDIVDYPTVHGPLGDIPAVQLQDGSVFLLDRLEETQDLIRRFTPASTARTHYVAPAAFPPSVDLSKNQTPIGNQAERGTCVSFAVAAAIEARYKSQYGLTLDVSEQYLNHIQKSNALFEQRRPNASIENQVGSWGGSSVIYELDLLMGKFGLPPEDTLPYVTYGAFGNTVEAGDNPFLDGDSPQRLVNDFNLSRKNTAYAIPFAYSTTMLPRAAQEAAKYRPAATEILPRNLLTQLDLYRAKLSEGYEVAFGVALTKGDPNPNNDIWEPGNTPWGGHAMLMIGYSDAKQAFLVKNSWGGSSYVWFSYNWITQGRVYEAATVVNVADPNTLTTPIEQTLVGNWALDFDGTSGALQISHVPGTFPSSAILGKVDRRLGAFIDAQGTLYRVNGAIQGQNLELYLDLDHADRDYGDLTGMHFTAQLFSVDHDFLAGSYVDNRDGKTKGFYAVRGGGLANKPGAGGAALDAYAGSWFLQADGTNPTGIRYSLDIKGAAPDGTLTISSLDAGNVTATVNPANPRAVVFHIAGETYDGWMFAGEPGVIAGVRTGGGAAISNGFVMTRSGASAAPVAHILTPADASHVFQGTPVTLSAQTFITDKVLTYEWRSTEVADGTNGFLGTGAQLTATFTTTGSRTIELKVTDNFGASASTGARITVDVPPPQPTIANIKINGTDVLFSGIQSPNPFVQQLGSILLNLEGIAAGGTPPYTLRWTWQYTDDITCALVEIGATWALDDVGIPCVKPGHGDLTLYVSDSASQMTSKTIHMQFISPPN